MGLWALPRSIQVPFLFTLFSKEKRYLNKKELLKDLKILRLTVFH